MTSARPDLPRVEKAPAQPPVAQGLMVGSLVAAILATVLLGWLASEVFAGDTAQFDQWARASLHRFASPALTRAMTGVSFLGFQFLYGAVPAVLIFFGLLRWKRAATWLAITIAGALLLNITLKWAFHRPRPEPWYGVAPHSYSFPSGHALMSFCFYGVLAGLVADRLRSRTLRLLCWSVATALIVLIGISRIYLGVHYASDVLAGYLTAAMWVAIVLAMDRWRMIRRRNRIEFEDLTGGD